jgi:hypothetical protein
MKNLVVVIATGLSTAAIGLSAPALAAPSAPDNAAHTISELEAMGFQVIVNRLSDTPLDQAGVVSVGAGPTFSHTESGTRNRDDYTGYDRQFAPSNKMTVYVNVR